MLFRVQMYDSNYKQHVLVGRIYAPLDISPPCCTDKGSTESCLGGRHQVKHPPVVTSAVYTKILLYTIDLLDFHAYGRLGERTTGQRD